MDRQSTDHISLSPSLERFVTQQVAKGRFESVNEAVERGVELLAQEEELLGLSHAALRRKLDRAAKQIKRGDVVDGEPFFAELRRSDREIAAKAKNKAPAKKARRRS